MNRAEIIMKNNLVHKEVHVETNHLDSSLEEYF